ncbi:transmembrane protein 231 [Lycorma delicatula]|uniref:transmembrane protein 231 n=1 Tax=Lycorma delicatula TaxID=130591 RepID=UPI003F512E4E
MYEIFSECVMYRYNSRFCSKGTIFVFFTTILTLLFPLMFTYKSHGFWMKTATYQEKPDVHFKYEYLFILQTESLDSLIICSTFPYLNNLYKDKNSCPIIKVREEDYNRDGYNDILHFELEALLENNENVYGITLILLFDYRLYGHCYLEMESLGVIQQMTSVPGSRFDYAADLQLLQKFPLHTKFHNTFYKKSIFHSKNFNIRDILKDYAARNVSTHLVNSYSVWSYGRAAIDPFIVSAQISYPSVTVMYKPGFWQEIKWAWMQYFPVLFPFILLFREIKRFIFSNHIIHTKKDVQWQKIS